MTNDPQYEIVNLQLQIRELRRRILDIEIAKPNRWECHFKTDYITLVKHEGCELIKISISDTVRERAVYLSLEQIKEIYESAIKLGNE